ncbi:MASE3 domain-containing protein [Geomonas ferrireducens]|uniref:MASE3 domain-containing protein n=1 Tax=Geomonas ferrireducens TaxID=2570227 RepID=UPI0010A8E87C|nr:MASE3 domain-containing protein [Geomonas ferrireducens]
MGGVATGNVMQRTETQVVSFVTFALAVLILYICSLYSYLLFHTLVELFCTIVTLGVFFIAWNSRRFLDNHYFLFLALAFSTSSVLQLLHTFSFKGLGIFIGYDANLPTQLWIASRYVVSLSFLAAPLFIVRKLHLQTALSAFVTASALLVFAIFSGNFPDCFIEGSGLTPFKIYSEYVIISILLAAAVLLYKNRASFDSRVFSALLVAVLSGAAADLAFTKYLSVYGQANLVGHLLLFLSSFMIYQAIVSTGLKQPAALLFRSLEQSEQALKRSEAQLQAALEQRTRELIEKEELNAELQRSEAALKRTNQRLDLLAASANRLLQSGAPQQLADELCREVMNFLGCDVFFNYLLDEAEGVLKLNACAGIGEKQAAEIQRLDLGVAICGCAARDACRIVAENIPETPDPRTELVKSLGVRAYACHPLLSQGRVLGTLSFGTRSRNSFNDDELSLMKAVADQVSIAMQRHLMEESLRQAKQVAEAASHTKSRFVANMSHELRTPMTGVLGMLDLALQTADDAERTEYIETAQRSARSLLRILNDVLDLAKVEAGKFSLDPKPFALRACLSQTVEVVMPEVRRKGLELALQVDEQLPDHVIGDQVRLRQVLTNLVGNAVKFTERGGVQIALRSGARAPDGSVEVSFSVRDTGIGIPEEKRHLLFSSFSQLDDSDTRSHGGTGLGLAISKEIIERMGGSIVLESEGGKGSCFSFSVRLGVADGASEEARPAVAPASFSPGTGKGRRLLVAEDDPTIRQVLGTMLGRIGYEIEFAEDGIQAVARWQEASFDMLIMDVQMPRVNGFEATRSIREIEAGGRAGRIPILAMTAHAMKDDEQRCIAAGMDDYISKPIDFRECLNKIHVLLG